MNQAELDSRYQLIKAEPLDLPRQVLQLLVAKYGYAAFDDPKRCEATLRKLCPKATREVDLLMALLNGRFVTKLLNLSSHLPKEYALKHVSEQLEDDLLIDDDFAYWAVESWALALGIIQQPLPKPVEAIAEVEEHIVAAVEQILEKDQPAPMSALLNGIPERPSTLARTARAEATPEQRLGKFVIKNSLAIDSHTGLMWCRFMYGQTWENDAPVGQAKKLTWRVALEAAESFNRDGGYAGFTDWRLPTVDELKTLIDKVKGRRGRFIDQAVFPGEMFLFWAALPGLSGNFDPWTVNFVNGNDGYGGNYNAYAVRLMRSGSSFLATA